MITQHVSCQRASIMGLIGLMMCLHAREGIAFLFPHHPRPSMLLSSPHSPPCVSYPSYSYIILILDDALKAYKKLILTALQERVQELNKSQRGNTKWLDPTMNVSHTFSETLGGVDSVFSPTKVIFTRFAVLLSLCPVLNPFVRSIVIQTILG